jgi:hypothetical protein
MRNRKEFLLELRTRVERDGVIPDVYIDTHSCQHCVVGHAMKIHGLSEKDLMDANGLSYESLIHEIDEGNLVNQNLAKFLDQTPITHDEYEDMQSINDRTANKVELLAYIDELIKNDEEASYV